MTHTPANLDLSVVARAQRPARILRDTLLVLLLTLVASLALAVYGTTPRAEAAERVRGEVDVCVLKADLGKSWTKGLQRRANREFSQRIDVQRITERQLDNGRHCDIVVWAGGKVAEDYVNGVPAANPRYHVYTGPYAMVAGEVNVGTSTPKAQRVNTLLQALRDLKAAGVLR